jgi:hypothetical protein
MRRAARLGIAMRDGHPDAAFRAVQPSRNALDARGGPLDVPAVGGLAHDRTLAPGRRVAYTDAPEDRGGATGDRGGATRSRGGVVHSPRRAVWRPLPSGGYGRSVSAPLRVVIGADDVLLREGIARLLDIGAARPSQPA